MSSLIDLNTLLPEETQLTPLFPDASDYREFRARYAEDVRPKLEELREARRKSEEDARQRLLS